jgi:hypothetical protein
MHLPYAGMVRFRFNGFAASHLSPCGHPEVRRTLSDAAGRYKGNHQVAISLDPSVLLAKLGGTISLGAGACRIRSILPSPAPS